MPAGEPHSRTPADEQNLDELDELRSLLRGIREILLHHTRRHDSKHFKIPTPLLIRITESLNRALELYDR